MSDDDEIRDPDWGRTKAAPQVGDFFNPDNWGYCEDCAFQVAYDSVRELLFKHTNTAGDSCRGSDRPRSEQPGKEVERYAFGEIEADGAD